MEDTQLQQLIDHVHIGKLKRVVLQKENEIEIRTSKGKFLIWKCDASVWQIIRDKSPQVKTGGVWERLMLSNYRGEQSLSSSWAHFQGNYFAFFYQP